MQNIRMEYQKIINLIGDAVEKQFQTKEFIKTNNLNYGAYNNKPIKIKTFMLRSSLCDFNNAYIKVKCRATMAGLAAGVVGRFIFKNCAPFRLCRSLINNTTIDKAEYIDMVIPMYNLIKYTNNYAKPAGSSYQFYRDETVPNIWKSASLTTKRDFNNDTTAGAARQECPPVVPAVTTRHVEAEINKPFQYLSNVWRMLEFLLINCEAEVQLTWSEDCLTGQKYNPGAAAGARNIALPAADILIFQITDTKSYIPVDNQKKVLPKQLIETKSFIQMDAVQMFFHCFKKSMFAVF